MCFFSAKKKNAHFRQNHWSEQLFEVLFLFSMCRNGGVGTTLFFLLCSVQALQAVDCWLFPSKCAFSALKSKIAILAKTKGCRKFQ